MNEELTSEEQAERDALGMMELQVAIWVEVYANQLVSRCKGSKFNLKAIEAKTRRYEVKLRARKGLPVQSQCYTI